MNVLKASLTSDAASAAAAKPQQNGQNGQSNGEASSAPPAGPDPAAKRVRWLYYLPRWPVEICFYTVRHGLVVVCLNLKSE